MKEKRPHRPEHAGCRVADDPPGVSPTPPGLLESADARATHQAAPEQVVEDVYPANGAFPSSISYR